MYTLTRMKEISNIDKGRTEIEIAMPVAISLNENPVTKRLSEKELCEDFGFPLISTLADMQWRILDTAEMVYRFRQGR